MFTEDQNRIEYNLFLAKNNKKYTNNYIIEDSAVDNHYVPIMLKKYITLYT